MFGLVYYIMAILNAIPPLWLLYQIIDSGILKLGGKFAVAAVLLWLVAAFAFWIGFQLWWARRKKPTALAALEFSATQIFSEILQTFGEWLGTLIGIIGADGHGFFELRPHERDNRPVSRLFLSSSCSVSWENSCVYSRLLQTTQRK